MTQSISNSNGKALLIATNTYNFTNNFNTTLIHDMLFNGKIKQSELFFK